MRVNRNSCFPMSKILRGACRLRPRVLPPSARGPYDGMETDLTGGGGRLKTKKLSTRIGILSTLLVLVSVSAATLLSYAYGAAIARGSVRASSIESGRVMSTILEERVRGVLRLTLASLASGAKQSALERFLADPGPENTGVALTEIAGRFIDLTLADPFIATIYLDTPRRAFFPFSDIARPDFRLADSELYRLAEPSLDRGPYWAPAMPDPIFSDQRSVIPVLIRFSLPSRPETLHLVLSLDATTIAATLRRSLPADGAFLLMDRSGGVLVGSEGMEPGLAELCRAHIPADSGAPGSTIASIGRRKAVLSWRPISAAPWTLVDVRYLDSLEATLGRLRWQSALLFLVLASIGVLMSALVATGTTRPLLRLRDTMGKVESGDFSVRYRPGSGDEVDWLGDRFNSMLDETVRLVDSREATIRELEAQREKTREEHAAKRSAERALLRARINPHLLYNALNSIVWMAERSGARAISDLAASLARYYRLSLNEGRERIAVADELEQARIFLEMQAARYGDRLRFSFDTEPRVANLEIPNLLVQPLVENSIVHGFRAGPAPLVIEVSAFAEDPSRLVIRIDDDGAGMSEGTMAAINARLASAGARAGGASPGDVRHGDGDSGAGYGIYNVNERLRLEYGPGFGLRYSPRPGGGTRAEIVIPRGAGAPS